jgi:hypothetical protein
MKGGRFPRLEGEEISRKDASAAAFSGFSLRLCVKYEIET